MALVAADIPLSLYLHWPWCLKKCPYCDFNSHGVKRDGIPEAEYLKALKADLLRKAPLAGARPLETVFIGGGTPSLMSAKGLEELISFLKSAFAVREDAEITMEVNPGTVERGMLRDIRSAGVNRVSLGIQSFQDEKLKALGRIHSAAEAEKAAGEASEVFENFNLDLMFGLPHQTPQDLEYDLRRALSFASPHLSYYQLTIEESTAFAKHIPEGLPEDDALSDMLDAIEEGTAKSGFEHYEVSAYAKKGHMCRHNRNYWEFGDYLASGPGAHAKVTRDGRIYRYSELRSPKLWLEAVASDLDAADEKREVTAEDLPFEFMLNALRLKDGVAFSAWEARTGLPFAAIEKTWDEGVRQGLLEKPEKRLVTTPRGWLFLNEAQELFL
jgi:oxygen-independent coproporphyrinogen-3 oxidase